MLGGADVEAVVHEVAFVAAADGPYLVQGFGEGSFGCVEGVELVGQVACDRVGGGCIPVPLGGRFFGGAICRASGFFDGFTEPFEVVGATGERVDVG